MVGALTARFGRRTVRVLGIPFVAGLLLMAVLASGSASADSSSRSRAALIRHIGQAIMAEHDAGYPLIAFQYARKGFDESADKITGAKAHLARALGLIADAKNDASQYESDALALPVSVRPADAIAGVHEVQNLLDRAARYDSAAQPVFDKLDEAYLSYRINGSESRREEVRRYAKVIRGDLETADERKHAADEAARKLPSLTTGVDCIVDGLSGTGPGYPGGGQPPNAQGDLTETCYSPIGFDTLILSSPGHTFSAANFDTTDNTTFISCTPGTSVTCKLTRTYQKKGGPISFGWHFAAGDSAQSGGSCGLTYQVSYTLAGKTVHTSHETAVANGSQNCTAACPPTGCGFAGDDPPAERNIAVLGWRRPR